MAWVIENYIIASLVFGFLLDSLLGDPMWLPHPIRWFGTAIAWFDKIMNHGKHRFIKGMLSNLILVLATYVLLYFLFSFVAAYGLLLIILTSLGVFFCLANHGLIREALKVEQVLQKHGIESARKQLRMIVGRNTSRLDANQIRTAVLETLAENLSDGVIAPLFYYAIGGVPLMLTYKMAQTMDSMWGYKSERYEQFGKFAARFDDVINFIPARITAMLMAVIAFSWRGFAFMFKYGRKHASPNAGYPEAALAGILNVQFGGPNIYHGKLMVKPFIGSNAREISHNDIIKACVINAGVAMVFVLLIIIFHILG